MIEEPPLLEGACQERITWESPDVAVRFCGEEGTDKLAVVPPGTLDKSDQFGTSSAVFRAK